MKWKAAINKLRDFDARVIIPGHCDEEKIQIMEEAQDDTSRTCTGCLDWSIEYLDVYEEAYNTARTGGELVEMINKRYGHIKAGDFAPHWQARMLFPHSSPDWFTPLPGKPGEIFLNPCGGFDGDPPRE